MLRCVPLGFQGMIINSLTAERWGFNSLAPGRFQFNIRKVILKQTLVNGCWGISYEIALRWMPLDHTDDKSTLVQVMAWCHQAPSHYLSHCWLRSMWPNGVTRPQWVNLICVIFYLIIDVSSICSEIILMWIQQDTTDEPSQWEMMLQCNVASHWLGTFTKRSLLMISQHWFRWILERQAITWTNVHQILWCNMTSPAANQLNIPQVTKAKSGP